MNGMEKSEALKKFKHFAVENGFWRKYKQEYEKHNDMSKLVSNCQTFLRNYYYLLEKGREPIQLIRNTDFFCQWSLTEDYDSGLWPNMSKKWMDFCIENQIWISEKNATRYYNEFKWF